MTSKDKLKGCYFIKNVLMILVVFYHSIVFWMPGGWFVAEPVFPSKLLGIVALWLNSFHIYGFTLVSGYIYYYMRYEKKSKTYINYREFLKNKAKRLLLPYGFVNLTWVMPIYIYFNGFEIKVLVRKFIFMESPAQLWFLIMLFGCFVIFYLFSDYVKAHTYVSGVVMLLLYVCGIIGSHITGNYFQIWSVCKYLFFFYTGFEFRRNGFNKYERIPALLYIGADIILFILWRLCEKNNVWCMKIIATGVRFSLHVIGAVGVFIILQKIFSVKKKNIVENTFAKYSMGIYLFHQQIIYFVLIWGNGKVNNYVLVGINLLLSSLGAFLISVILNKNRYTRFLISGKMR